MLSHLRESGRKCWSKWYCWWWNIYLLKCTVSVLWKVHTNVTPISSTGSPVFEDFLCFFFFPLYFFMYTTDAYLELASVCILYLCRFWLWSSSLEFICFQLLHGKHLMVRVGGGWDTFENYLLHHDPIQVYEFRRPASRDSSRNNFDGYLVIKSKYKSLWASSSMLGCVFREWALSLPWLDGECHSKNQRWDLYSVCFDCSCMYVYCSENPGAFGVGGSCDVMINTGFILGILTHCRQAAFLLCFLGWQVKLFSLVALLQRELLSHASTLLPQN